ncbi:HD domain-containing phosphohydrolase [Dethiosulfatarculus sandiegensis]|uniref:Chemotaxis protein CheY n=1 Tax=Dethiosulfatarculus sandiegensis TaxID=1429043 RepID=A0A0D2JA99_9BACT|nr:HD domain-containing phosphohydrolase [Dethiosulfatarculus sandiegensis]KIX12661.1 chemotaxis protein CheY [Dethiosulfatarculus sandiegensis]
MPIKDLRGCKVLVVDDSEANVDIMVDALGDDYDVSVAMDGHAALEAIYESPPDLILLDILMPGLDGYEVCRRLKAEATTAGIPVIFLTAMSEVGDKTRGFKLGAVDYITKPFEVLEVQARLKTHLSLVLASREQKQQNEILEEKVQERTRELLLTQDVIIHSLTTLCETRDDETGGHILRTQFYVDTLAKRLLSNSPYTGQLDLDMIRLFFKSAPLHDIGKVGVPDAILFKPGPLTQREFAIMQGHCELGRRTLENSEKLFLDKNIPSFLVHAKDIAHTHHERWDGSGYPRGLAGEEIPLSGRIMALADVYDALISKRAYKQPSTHDQAADIITQQIGSHFDPVLVEAFLAVQNEFQAIANRFADPEQKPPMPDSREWPPQNAKRQGPASP